jgi:hypothetical protein
MSERDFQRLAFRDTHKIVDCRLSKLFVLLGAFASHQHLMISSLMIALEVILSRSQDVAGITYHVSRITQDVAGSNAAGSNADGSTGTCTEVFVSTQNVGKVICFLELFRVKPAETRTT